MKKAYIDENGNVTRVKPRLAKASLETLQRSIKPVNWFTESELIAVSTGELFVFDTECYVNFWYCAFMHVKSGKVFAVEQSPACQLNSSLLLWALWRFCIVGFNSHTYDLPMITLALKGVSNARLKEASDFIIKSGQNFGTKKNTNFDFEREFKVKIVDYNHIDLFNVCPVNGGVSANPASLKLYAARLHCERMQDLPFEENRVLTADDAAIVRPYCANDLDNTKLLFTELAPEIKVRIDMSERYGLDLRSKSDAQLAETVINSELTKILGHYVRRPTITDDVVLKYELPDFISFKTEKLQKVLEVVLKADFYLDGLGSPIAPIAFENLKVEIGNSVYTLGMGGLHSNEKKVAHIATDEIIIEDNDVESFYPRIILNQKLFPFHLTEAFLKVYNTIVETRLDAKAKAAQYKKAGDKENAEQFASIAGSLKIVINGSFGKFGNKWSTLYAPQLMLQVTITGQLVLLMLIEMLEGIGIEVISGNTDGIISKFHKSRNGEVRNIIAMWESVTNFKTEATRYSAVYSRDVNSYIAVKTSAGDTEARFLDERLSCKTKGAFSERGSALNSILSKNPEVLICTDAVLQHIKNNTPIEQTIRACKDMRRFVTVRNVKGGAEKNGIYLGKVVRWYYSKNEAGCISYVLSGNKVAKTDGAVPLMDMPTIMPDDINYAWYIAEALEMLYDCGKLRTADNQSLLFQ